MSTTPRLFKYSSVDVGRAVLSHKTLRWSRPALFNDPFDMQIHLALDIDENALTERAIDKISAAFADPGFSPGNHTGQLIARLKAQGTNLNRDEVSSKFEGPIKQGLLTLRKNLPSFNEEFIGKMASSKILCLSDIADSVTMWSHYASNHRGVVFEFGSPDGVDSPWRTAKKVNYVDNSPHFFDLEFLSDFMAGYKSLDVFAIMDLYVYTKGRQWDYEREWRIHAGDGRNHQADYEDIGFHKKELVGVIFGCRADQAIVSELSSLALKINPDLSIHQARKTGLTLEFERLR